MFVVTCGATVSIAAAVGWRGSRPVVLVILFMGESALTMGLFAIRQWRLAPRARALGGGVIVGAALGLVVHDRRCRYR